MSTQYLDAILGDMSRSFLDIPKSSQVSPSSLIEDVPDSTVKPNAPIATNVVHSIPNLRAMERDAMLDLRSVDEVALPNRIYKLSAAVRGRRQSGKADVKPVLTDVLINNIEAGMSHHSSLQVDHSCGNNVPVWQSQVCSNILQ